ncbi:MAG: hypothetical protein AAFU71_03500 [Cyanobacteria bacterium J06632_22]
MFARGQKLVAIFLLTGLFYLGAGGVLYLNARFSKALVHTSSHSAGDVAWHGISPGEYRPDGPLYLFLLRPFVLGEIAVWYMVMPVGSPYPYKIDLP